MLNHLIEILGSINAYLNDSVVGSERSDKILNQVEFLDMTL